MKLSIIVPVYNVKQYIDKCITSILDQSFKDFELILVDDGSTDGSGDVCETYAKLDHRVHVYHQANVFLANLERKLLRIPQEKYYVSIENTGNTVSSTIPIALCEAMKEGKLHEGMKVLSLAQGLGYTWGGMVLFF